MVDIATRVWNHKWKIDPIVRSLIDTDFYKLLMCQSVFRNKRDTNVTFSLSYPVAAADTWGIDLATGEHLLRQTADVYL